MNEIVYYSIITFYYCLTYNIKKSYLSLKIHIITAPLKKKKIKTFKNSKTLSQ